MNSVFSAYYTLFQLPRLEDMDAQAKGVLVGLVKEHTDGAERLQWLAVLDDGSIDPEEAYASAPSIPMLMALFDRLPFRSQAWVDLTGVNTDPVFELGPKMELYDSLYQGLLLRLQKRLEILTAQGVKACLEHLQTLPTPEDCAAHLASLHPHVAYMVVTNCCAKLRTLGAYRSMSAAECKSEFKLIKELVIQPEHVNDAEWYRREFLRTLDRMCGAGGPVDPQKALEVGDIIEGYNRLRRLGPVDPSEVDQMVPVTDRSVWFRALCALKRIKVVDQRIKDLVEKIGRVNSKKELALVLDAADEAIVYDTCLAHMKDISLKVRPHMGTQVINVCNTLVARMWRDQNPQEAEELEAKYKASLLRASGMHNYAQALDNLFAAKARGCEIEEAAGPVDDDDADSVDESEEESEDDE